MKYVLFIIGFALAFSCSNSVETSVTEPAAELVGFNSSSQMIEIPGGNYVPFFGQDSLQEVHVSSFLMDQTLVTNQDYLNFLKANPQWTRSQIKGLYADANYLKNWKSDFEIPEGISPDAPVSNVSWYAAKAYAASLGKRLPTVDEWEYVGVANLTVPNAANDPEFTNQILASYKTGDRYRIPVKSGQPNYYGIYDMYGSVWEWTSDFNSVMMTGESRNNNIKNENLFCAGASLTATDLKNYAAFIRFAMRGSVKANYCINNLGFRCVQDL